MNMHKLIALLALLGSCSFGMSGVDPKWDGTREPNCTDTYTPVAVDGFAAAMISGTLVEVSKDYPVDTSVVVGAVAVSLLYMVSARVGASRYKECRLAKADWYVREAIRARNEHADDALRSVSAPRSSELPSVPLGSTTSAQQATKTVGTGYFCTSSLARTEATMCVRERATCARAQRVLTAPDGEGCARRRSAWCFEIGGDLRCFATRPACQAQASAGGGSSACTERS
jgi:hypothetical protein